MSAIGSNGVASIGMSYVSQPTAECQVVKAAPGDVDGILEVLEFNRDKFLTDSREENTKNGFLVYPFTKEELLSWIDDDKFKVLVVRDRQNGIIGYTLGYALTTERQLSEFASTSEYSQMIDPGNRIYYLRHIAVRSTHDQQKGVGKALLQQLIILLQNEGFTHIVDEICEEPINNERSRDFHLRNGFRKIGDVRGSDNILWGVYFKNL